VLASPCVLIGSIDAIVEKLLEQRERHGFSYLSVFPPDTETVAPVVARLAGKYSTRASETSGVPGQPVLRPR
jgi:hypothetical protein